MIMVTNNPQIVHSDVELILFDVGGVLCELGESPVPVEWIPDDQQFTLQDWFHSEIARSFETGNISPGDLATAFRQELGLEQGVEAILAHFDDWLIGPYPETLGMLESIDSAYRLAVLSNTNELHWPKINDSFGLAPYFERIFSSHLLKLAKPDPAIFEQVAAELQVEHSRVLFLDDNQQNVDSARSLGITSVLVQGPDQVRAALERFGVIGLPGIERTGPHDE